MLLAAFAVQLSRCERREDLLVGSGVANRRLGRRRVVGMSVNTVALRIDACGDPTAAELAAARLRDGRVRR